jgi:diphosphomevalonate decarboxylase
MTLSDKVQWDAPIDYLQDSRMVTVWQSPANIALVKYWGKYGRQIPANPSLSLTLQHSVTTMEVSVQPVGKGNGSLKEFYFEGESHPEFGKRFGTILQSLQSEFQFLANYDLFIKSSNSFPHSAGIASSASGFSALALCLCTLELSLSQVKTDEIQFLQKASTIARLGSGSASRSIYPGFSVWGKTHEFAGTDDHYAIPVNEQIHEEFSDIRDAVLVINSGKKAVSSSKGHSLMQDHPYREGRILQACNNISMLAGSLRSGDWNTFILVTEAEALSLHSLMMSSSPGFLLMEPATIEVINRITRFRNQTSIPVCFTLDAGPNVHLIYRKREQDEVRDFINTQLIQYCEEGRWIDDEAGTGPKRLK